MSTVVKKWNRISIYQIGELESYLSDMAKKGLIYKEFGKYFNTFIKGEPQDLEFRIELMPKLLSEERIGLYHHCGWSYVNSYQGTHVFVAQSSKDLIEVHTDPVEQSYALEHGISMCKKELVVPSLLICLFMACVMWSIMANYTPYLNFLVSGLPNIVGIIVFLYLISTWILQLFQLKKLQAFLKRGIPINHHAIWKKGNNAIAASALFFTFITVLTLVPLFYEIPYIVRTIEGKTRFTLTFDTKLPIVRLNDIEQYENPLMNIDVEDINYNNMVDTTNAFLYQKYEVTESFDQTGELFNGEDYKPTLLTKYYKIKLPILADGVLHDLIREAQSSYTIKKSITLQKLNQNGFDQAYYLKYEYDDFYTIFVQKGNVIASMAYFGKQPYEKVLAAAENKL